MLVLGLNDYKRVELGQGRRKRVLGDVVTSKVRGGNGRQGVSSEKFSWAGGRVGLKVRGSGVFILKPVRGC